MYFFILEVTHLDCPLKRLDKKPCHQALRPYHEQPPKEDHLQHKSGSSKHSVIIGRAQREAPRHRRRKRDVYGMNGARAAIGRPQEIRGDSHWVTGLGLEAADGDDHVGAGRGVLAE